MSFFEGLFKLVTENTKINITIGRDETTIDDQREEFLKNKERRKEKNVYVEDVEEKEIVTKPKKEEIKYKKNYEERRPKFKTNDEPVKNKKETAEKKTRKGGNKNITKRD
jgi:hypothetical protein